MKQSGGAETCTFLEEPVILSTYALHGWYYHKGLHPYSFLLGFVHSFIHRFSLLTMGYSLKQLLKTAEETAAIRKSRQQNMKGRFDSFKKVFTIAVKASSSKSSKSKGSPAVIPTPNIIASRSG